MGVITSSGVVGTVVEVSERFARVMSVLHIQNKINARVKRNRHLGNIEWDGKNYRKGILTDIPGHVVLRQGDTIITSGNSMLFPEGIFLGTVDEFANQVRDNFNYATINFAVDYNSLEHAFVITNLMRTEIQNLTEEANE
jgi:rod shape-determining protein MreC